VRHLDELGVYGDILRTQLETCSRISEITGMQWTEVDLDEAVWVLPAGRSKNKRGHKVMLAERTVDRLRKRTATSTSGFIFPARTDPARPIRTDVVVRKLAENRATLGVYDGFTSHSIRHGCLTWLAENGCPRDVRDRISNHAPASSGGVDHIYNSAELNRPAREWLGRWVDHLTMLQAENVIAIDRGKA
jgi:integrase